MKIQIKQKIEDKHILHSFSFDESTLSYYITCLHHCFTNTHHTFIYEQLRSPNQRCSATCNPLGPCFSSPLTLVLLRHQLTLHVEECLPNLHAGVHDKLTYVRYYLSDALVADLFLLPPPLCILELAPSMAKPAACSELLASVVSRD